MVTVVLVTIASLAVVPAIMWVVGTFGGWGRMARAFPGDYVPSGTTYRGRSVEILPVTNYGNCITTIVAPEGLWMSPIWVFRLGHPPVLVPWRYVERVEARGGMFPKTIVHFNLDGVRGRLHLPPDALDKMTRFIPNRPASPMYAGTTR